MGWVVAFAVAVAIVYGIAIFLAEAAKAVGEAVDSSVASTSNALTALHKFIAGVVGRAGKKGVTVEVFRPKLSIALPTGWETAEMEESKRAWRDRVSVSKPPAVIVPTFPEIPDPIARPEVQFSLGGPSTLAEHHIPTLLHGRSTMCSLAPSLDKLSTPSELAIPVWERADGFPRPPASQAVTSLPETEIALDLPLYEALEQSGWLRKWAVRQLNRRVRDVHRARIAFFESKKREIQDAYDAQALANARAKVAYECRLAAWESVKKEVESERQRAAEAFTERCAKSQEVYRTRRNEYEQRFGEASARLSSFWDRLRAAEPIAVCHIVDIGIARIVTPVAFPREWVCEYDRNEGILVVDIRLPDFERIQITRQVALKRETKTKPVTAKEQKRLSEVAACTYLLRVLHEIVKHDPCDVIKAVTLNGWVEYIDAATGQDRSIVIVSLFAGKGDLEAIDIARVDPVKCISALGGRFAGVEHGYVAIAPIVRLNRHDDRVIEGSDVLTELASGSNLAAMDWDKFEHLIRQLFEKVFAGPEIEVKVTRASRDRGVDAIIFDPDPIKGGKTVIQAKRYVNTVDLSAVRDLYGTVVNEGANKGILVTTSSFGPDAYDFAKDKNLTLLTGRELLGLLEKHGYHYRIDLEEARRLHASATANPQPAPKRPV